MAIQLQLHSRDFGIHSTTAPPPPSSSSDHQFHQLCHLLNHHHLLLQPREDHHAAQISGNNNDHLLLLQQYCLTQSDLHQSLSSFVSEMPSDHIDRFIRLQVVFNLLRFLF